jgi:hypothetical protein
MDAVPSVAPPVREKVTVPVGWIGENVALKVSG